MKDTDVETTKFDTCRTEWHPASECERRNQAFMKEVVIFHSMTYDDVAGCAVNLQTFGPDLCSTCFKDVLLLVYSQNRTDGSKNNVKLPTLHYSQGEPRNSTVVGEYTFQVDWQYLEGIGCRNGSTKELKWVNCDAEYSVTLPSNDIKFLQFQIWMIQFHNASVPSLAFTAANESSIIQTMEKVNRTRELALPIVLCSSDINCNEVHTGAYRPRETVHISWNVSGYSQQSAQNQTNFTILATDGTVVYNLTEETEYKAENGSQIYSVQLGDFTGDIRILIKTRSTPPESLARVKEDIVTVSLYVNEPKPEKGGSSALLIFIVLVCLIAVGVVFWIRRRSKMEEEGEELNKYHLHKESDTGVEISMRMKPNYE